MWISKLISAWLFQFGLTEEFEYDDYEVAPHGATGHSSIDCKQQCNGNYGKCDACKENGIGPDAWCCNIMNTDCPTKAVNALKQHLLQNTDHQSDHTPVMTNLNMCVQAHHFSIMVGSEEFLIPWHDNDVDHDTHNCFTSCNSQVGSCASCDLDGQQGYCCPHTNDVLQKPNFCSAGDMSSKLFSAVSQHYNNPDHFNHHMLAGIIPPGSTKLEHTCVVAPKSPCYPNPCLNSGECAVSGDKAVCTCKTGFSGDLCATTPCSATPCKNSGVCSVSVAGDGSGTFACDCTGTGFTGATCEDTSPCASDPCKNGGTCKDASNALGYECSCLSGFGGDQCQNDPCSTNPCNNGGTCAVVMVSKDNASVGTAVCTCKGVFIGPTCDNKPCDSNPCQNGGTCTDVDGGTFTCACKNGYSGNTCTESVCDSKPCKYEGTCSVNDAVSPYYACTCKSGYSGPTCETTPCSTDPCLNGGTCKLANNANGYTCSCPDGIFGDKCQINCNAVSIVTLDCQTDFVISLTVDMNCFGFYYPGSDVKDIKITAAASNEVTVGNTCTSFATGESGNNHIYSDAQLTAEVAPTTSKLYFDRNGR